MPPPELPSAAAKGLAGAVADTVTGVSFSDVSRGVTEALRRGLTVVDFTFAQRVCDEAHGASKHGEGHSAEGFCRVCSQIYVAVNHALSSYR